MVPELVQCKVTAEVSNSYVIVKHAPLLHIISYIISPSCSHHLHNIYRDSEMC